jgi:hypothetical protein
LNKSETRLLIAAAGREDGRLILPTPMRAATAERLLEKLTKVGLITSREQDGALEHHPTPAGYRAIGLKPPRRPRAVVGASSPDPAGRLVTKRALILDLIGRGAGASLRELIAATRRLRHTTRAALSHIRSSGQTLMKSTRPDGRTAYRIVPDEAQPETKPARKRAARPSRDQVEAVA